MASFSEGRSSIERGSFDEAGSSIERGSFDEAGSSIEPARYALWWKCRNTGSSSSSPLV